MEIRENTLQYKIKKKLPPLLLAILVVYLIWQAFGSMLPGLLPLLREGDEQQIAEYLSEQQGAKGIISVILLSGIQVVSVVLPGLAIQIAAGLIYGWWKGFLMCYAGFVAANAMVFAFVKRMGGDKTKEVAIGGTGRKVLEKLRSTPPPFMICLLNMIPAVPNGIIPYLAAQMNITLPEFVEAVMAGSVLQILVGCLAGTFIMNGDWLYMIITFIIQVAVVVVIFWQRDRLIPWVQVKKGQIRQKIRTSFRKENPEQADPSGESAKVISTVFTEAAQETQTVGERVAGLGTKLETIRKGIIRSGSGREKGHRDSDGG